MNILLVTHIFPPAIDGGSRVIAKIGEYLNIKGHQITVLTTNCQSTDDFVNPKSKIIKDSKKINHFSSIYRLPVYKTFRRPLKLLEIIFSKLFFLKKNNLFLSTLRLGQKGPLFKLIPFIKTIYKLKNQKIDLIIAGPLPTTTVLYASFLKKLFNTRLLVNASFHQTDKDFLNQLLINTLQQSDLIWSLTQYEKNYFINDLKIDPKKIILAGNGVDPSLIVKDNAVKFPQNPNLLFIGSLSQHKRVELLINSFSKLFKKFPHLTLTIAGQKTLYYPKINSFVNTLPKDISSKIIFKFNFSQSELNKLIDNCSILILPSIQESFGLVLIESWSRGKPVITSNIPSLSEMINKTKGGLIFNTDSLKSLENKINKLLNNSKLCQELGKNGLEYVKNNYTWTQVTNKLCQNIF